MKLSGNTIFITGGGSGIGRGLAEALHKLGNKVIIGGRRRSHLDAVIAANPGMAAVELDITDPTSINQVAAKLIAEHPDLNVLINNAGIMQPDAAAGHIDDAQMVATVTTNLMGPIRLTSALIDHLKGKSDAVVAYTSSGLGFVPLAQFIKKTIAVLRTDADEILVDAAKPLRANAGANEHALVNRFNTQMTAIFAGG